MASDVQYLTYILDQLKSVEGISYRAMMGEYVLYCRGIVFGGIYDDRFLIKDTPSARRLLPDALSEIPYEGAKTMIRVPDTDDRELLSLLIPAVTAECPVPKRNRKKEFV